MTGVADATCLDRRASVAALVRDRGDLLVVSGLGGTTWDLASAGDHDLNFYLWGGMGSAVPLGLGLALARPGRGVLVVTGDGEMLMGLGAFATVAAQAPANLAVAVIDNERYGETGDQLTHTALGTDLAAAARAAGIGNAVTVREHADLDAFRDRIHALRGPIVGVLKVMHENAGMVLPPRDGHYLRQRFRRGLLGDTAE